MRGSRQSVPNIHKKVPKIIWERGETAPNIFVRSYKGAAIINLFQNKMSLVLGRTLGLNDLWVRVWNLEETIRFETL